MKSISKVNHLLGVIIQMFFFLGAHSSAYADYELTETGYFKVTVSQAISTDVTSFILANKTIQSAYLNPPLSSSDCSTKYVVGGNLNFDSVKSLYSAALAAALAGKQITIAFNYSDVGCVLRSITVNP